MSDNKVILNYDGNSYEYQLWIVLSETEESIFQN